MRSSFFVAFLVALLVCDFGISGIMQFSIAQNVTETTNTTTPIITFTPNTSSTLGPIQTSNQTPAQNSFNTLPAIIIAIMIIIIAVAAIMLVRIFRK